MKKRELLEFIDKVQAKAVNSVETKHNKLIEEAKAALLKSKGYVDRIECIQAVINTVHPEVEALLLDLKDDMDIKYNDSYALSGDLLKWTGDYTIYKRIASRSKFENNPDIMKLRRDKQAEIDAVKENYGTVKAVCSAMLSANKIAEYLKGLGFDLSSLEKQETGLLPYVDRSKLFVCGENK